MLKTRICTKSRSTIRRRLGEACQLVGELGNPVKTWCMLAAVILESPSWEQCGSDGAEFNAGWAEDRLICSVFSSRNTSRTQTFRLATGERIIAWVIAAGTSSVRQLRWQWLFCDVVLSAMEAAPVRNRCYPAVWSVGLQPNPNRERGNLSPRKNASRPPFILSCRRRRRSTARIDRSPIDIKSSRN